MTRKNSLSHLLAGTQLYHGTNADIAVGGRVKPGRSVGRNNFDMRTVDDDPVQDHAFATHEEGYAWRVAHSVSQMNGGRGRVYTVDPHPHQRPGLYNGAHPRFRVGAGPGEDLAEHVAPHFPVTGRLDIKPGHQGTFPNLNWRQFSRAPHLDVNHPSPDDVERGHQGSEMARREYFKKSQAEFADDQHTRDVAAIKDVQAERAAGRKQLELPL